MIKIAQMNLAHLLPLTHPTLSTPQAARRLLRLFAFSLAVSVYIGAYSYLRLALNQEISSRRSFMNEAIFEAQGFFVSHHALLKGLGLATVMQSVLPLAEAGKIPEEENHFVFSGGRDTLSLRLTQRTLEYLQDNHLNLIYVPHSAEAQVQYLSSVSDRAAVPQRVLDHIHKVDDALPPSNEIWLMDQPKLDPRLYIFVRVDERHVTSGWLGLEIDGLTLIQALRHEQAGDFKLLDTSGQTILSNTAMPLWLDRMGELAPAAASFGWEGGHWLPERLTIRKTLGYAKWQIVYSLRLTSLLPALAMPFAIALLICLLATMLMLLLVRRINQRLIVPAAARIDALVESESFCSAVIRIAPVALCVLRRSDGAVVLENPLSVYWLANGDERTRLCHNWIDRAFSVDSQRSISDELQMADGRHLQLSYAPTRYQREDVLICAFSDITERKNAEIALKQARTLADAANEAKTLFLATMSHEIRTPLYGVLGTLELLSRTQLDAQQRGYLSAIEGSSATLLQLICDVLDVSKIEAGQLALELSSFSPLEVTQDMIQSYTGAALSKGLQIFAIIDPLLPEQVVGDVTRIRQILGNLLSNAVKFTELGRVVVRLKLVWCEGERATLEWQVVDTGKGIPEKDQHNLFEPFFQSSPNANLIAGTGLGLSICKRLVHLMNGSLRVFSEPGLGSSFAFSLQLEQVAPQEPYSWAKPLFNERIYVYSQVQELADHTAAWLRRWGARVQILEQVDGHTNAGSVLVELCPGPASTVPRAGWNGNRVLVAQDGHGIVKIACHTWQIGLNNLHALSSAVSQALGTELPDETVIQPRQQQARLNLHILVVEDNMINQLILRDQLDELGCSVVLASDGVEALALWQGTHFDVVLTDVNMPRMNGYELTKQLRALDCGVPIVGATANAMLDETERWLDAGMDQLLVKPFTLYALYQCLQPYQRSVP